MVFVPESEENDVISGVSSTSSVAAIAAVRLVVRETIA